MMFRSIRQQTRRIAFVPQILYDSDISIFVRQKSSRKANLRPERIDIEVADSVEDELLKDTFKAKHHPGIIHQKKTLIPANILENIKQYINQKAEPKGLRKTADEFFEELLRRQLPVERAEFREAYAKAAQEIESKDQILVPFLSQEERHQLEVVNANRIKQHLSKMIYLWKPVNYDEETCLKYLAARSPLEYSILHQVFSEIRTRDASFQPQNLFDFGSGVGTAMWAANTIWPKVIQEHYNVDTSIDMHDISERLIRSKSSDKDELMFKNVFYRQFLPSSRFRTYDLIVSSFSMLDLPSASTRLEIIKHLWEMTEKYLVLIDYGNRSGFAALNQARDFIIRPDKKEDDKFHKFHARGHVFAPCPHDEYCPRFLAGYNACKFPIKYQPLLPFEKELTHKGMFSYFVLKKDERSPYDERWPRVIEVPLIRGGHTICRLCTSSGKICETIVTKHKPTREIYRCAKKSKPGDLLPIKCLGKDEDRDFLRPISEEELRAQGEDPEDHNT